MTIISYTVKTVKLKARKKSDVFNSWSTWLKRSFNIPYSFKNLFKYI